MGFVAKLCMFLLGYQCSFDLHTSLVTHHAKLKGVRWLLSERTDSWGWGTRKEAEAVMALQLVNDKWYRPSKPGPAATVKEMNLDLLAAISKYPKLDTQDWYGGKLGQYVNALVATCQDPSDFYGHNLIDILSGHMDGFPKYYFNHNFAYSWAVLALCNAGLTVQEKYIQQLTKTPGNYTFGVDEAAMTVIALSCVRNQTDVKSAISAGVQFILDNKKPDGSFGNEYTTGLAVQALIADDKQTRRKIKKEALLRLVEKQGQDGSYDSVAAANQIFPALNRKSYADIGSISSCQQVTTTPAPTTPPASFFTFRINVIATLAPHNVNESFTVTVPDGSSLLDAMVVLRDTDSNFTFTSKESSFGTSISSIQGIASDPDARTYWRSAVAPDTALTTSVDGFFPTAGMTVIFSLSTY
ncbi:transcobalamin-2 [Lingula anatina]|uniref:Transcobalamin-2 n=1 Tax=Lingula anatina TaxID=7574 RepID=A0A1S3JP28_LINAN|nr:transcobalamin-2 [Lingula anatina]|eukprot:XP_013412113.1 transcobalamin-2 [Lingula anatina]